MALESIDPAFRHLVWVWKTMENLDFELQNYKSDDGDGMLCVDTDSDVAEQRESCKVKVKWTHEEDDNLKIMVHNFGKSDWKTIVSFLPGRTEYQCMHRYMKALDPDIIKGQRRRMTRSLSW